jgi:hypothetical protein
MTKRTAKYFLTAGMFLTLSASVAAQTLTAGFYRIQNTVTKRYMKVIDNKGELNMQTTTPDLAALITVSANVVPAADAATVVYINPVGNGQYNVLAQGADMHGIIGYYIRFKGNSATPTVWRAYQTDSGYTVYLDDTDFSDDEGRVMTNDSSTRDWYITPITSTGTNYVGVQPTVQVGDKYYALYYASYSYKLASVGMHAYYVSYTDREGCNLKEIKGTIPPATPVVIECSSNNPSDNRLELQSATGTSLENNKLTGVYFNIKKGTKHINRVAYDKNTMRMLGTLPDGSLGFVTSDIDYIPMNTGYLNVPSASNANITIDLKDAIESVSASEKKSSATIYTIDGINTGTTDATQLTKGIYIQNGKKFEVQ